MSTDGSDPTATGPRTVLLVGHCGPDAWMLKSVVGRAIDRADVRMVNSDDDLRAAVSDASLLLVNRVLDGRFDTESGIDLIRDFAGSADAPPCMLVSNFEDAQEAAERAGARPGFGKRDAGTEQTADRLRAAVGT